MVRCAGVGLEASAAKRGADEMADRHLIENREAAVRVQMFHLRQHWGAAIWRAQTQALLGRLSEVRSARVAHGAAVVFLLGFWFWCGHPAAKMGHFFASVAAVGACWAT
jgi:hypothetical protein